MSNHRSRDLAPQRLAKLRRILCARRIVRVEELGAELGASSATVRRDLRDLETRGELHRVHGGAVAVERRLDEPGFDDKTALAAAEKQAIAAAALRLVQPRDSLFLDGGSTVLALARLLRERTDVKLVTNSLRVAAEMAGGGPPLIVVGGELRRLSQTFVGPLTRHQLDHLHVDRAFMGTMGLTPEAGLTTTDPLEAYTKSLVMQHAGQVILLADRSKFGQVSFARFGSLEDLHAIVTDRGLDRRTARALQRRGVTIITA